MKKNQREILELKKTSNKEKFHREHQKQTSSCRRKICELKDRSFEIIMSEDNKE